MDRTGVTNKRGHCQISFVYLGERYRPVLTGFQYSKATDRKIAAEKLAAVRREIQLGTFYFPKYFPDHPAAKRFRKGHQITVESALTEWLTEARTRVEPTTFHGYRKDIKYHLIPALGHFRLSEIRTSDIEGWLATLKVCGKTKNNILIPLRSVFKKALRDEKIERDPVEKIALFKHKPKEPNPLERHEIDAILGACDGQIRNIIEFAIMTGMRTSDLIAVRWIDVDFGAKTVDVKMTRTSRGEKMYGKTKTSVRTIDLSPPAIAALKHQMEFTEGKTFVFDNPRTGEPWKHDGPFRKTAWTQVLKKAGVKYRPPYQTRHTYASTLLSNGIEPMYVAAQLGHRDWGMIRKVYGKWMQGRSQSQRDKIALIWEPQRNRKRA